MVHSAVTQAQVARHAGVSQSVVSAVLAENFAKIGVGEDVRQRVRASAQKLGYKVDSSARSLRSGRFGSIGYAVTVSHFVDFDFALSRTGVAEACAQAGVRVVQVRLPAAGEPDELDVPQVLREQHLDGLIVHHSRPFSARLNRAIKTWGGPTVHLNARLPRPCVWLDDVAGGAMMTQHLIDQGYRQIAFVRTWPDTSSHYSDADRPAGYEKAMTAAGLEARRFTAASYDFDACREAFLAWLKRQPRIDAFFCYSDSDVGALQQWLLDEPRRLFRDYAVAGYDDTPDWQRIYSNRLTTARVGRREMSVEAARLLFQQITSGEPSRRCVRFKPELVVRESTKSLLEK